MIKLITVFGGSFVREVVVMHVDASVFIVRELMSITYLL